MRAQAPTTAMAFHYALFLTTPLAHAFSLRSLIPGVQSRGGSLSRRQENSTVIPAAIPIGPSQYWEGKDGAWSSFAIQVGNHAQTVRVMPGTAASVTLCVTSQGCPDGYGPLQQCEDSRGGLFLSNESLTWVPNSFYNVGIEKNLDLDISGAESGFDTVTLGWPGAGGPTVEHAIVQNYGLPNFWLGIFGLRADPTNFTTFNNPQPSFMTQLVNNNTIPSLSYGYTAGAQYRLGGVYGSLTLGGYDQNRFDSANNISVAMHEDINRDLLVYLQAITTDSGTPSNLLPDGAIDIFIDSTVAQLWLPESACEAFEQAFGLVWDDYWKYYTVNNSLHNDLVERDANVTLTLGGQESGGSTIDVVLPYAAFDLNLSYPYIVEPNNTYYFPLKRADNDTQYTLGRTFLQEAFLIADYDNRNFTLAPCTWDQDRVSQTSPVSIIRANATQNANEDDGNSTDVGAIAGGVVGGVLGLAIIAALIVFFLRRRRRAEKKRLAELEAKDPANVNGVAGSAGSGKPFISSPIGGELGGDAEIHEMNAPYKQQAQEMESPYKTNPSQHGYSEMSGGSGYFAPGKDGRVAEMEGQTPIFEMPGSEVAEMANNEKRPPPPPKN